jgi:saccharopine dehydrogenase-like NADP-dependent oxidoreductase
MENGRIVVIGAAGEMASVGVERFQAQHPELRLELYDLDAGKLDALAARLPAGRVTTGGLDLFDAAALGRAIEGASLVVLGAGPYVRTAPPVVRACIEAGVDYLDFDDEIESTQDALELDDAARAAGISCLKGCGASPGMSNVLALDAASHLDEVETFDLCWVTGDEGPRHYGAAVVEHLLHIGAGESLTWRDGRHVRVETFVDNDVFPFGGAIGDYRVYETAHPEVVTLPRRFPDARSIRVLGGGHPQPVNGVIRGISLAVERGRMTVPEAVEWLQAVFQDESGSLRGWRYALSGMLGQVRRRESSLSALARYMWLGLRGRHVPYRGALLVRATGGRGGIPATVTVRTPTGGPETLLASSMAAITGTCLAAFSTLALRRGSEAHGVVAPEDWVDPPDFYAALERLGVPRGEIDLERVVTIADEPADSRVGRAVTA